MDARPTPTIATLISMDPIPRLQRTQAAIEQHRLDVLLITHLPNIRYLCGFTGSAGVLVITAREKVSADRWPLYGAGEAGGQRGEGKDR